MPSPKQSRVEITTFMPTCPVEAQHHRRQIAVHVTTPPPKRLPPAPPIVALAASPQLLQRRRIPQCRHARVLLRAASHRDVLQRKLGQRRRAVAAQCVGG